MSRNTREWSRHDDANIEMWAGQQHLTLAAPAHISTNFHIMARIGVSALGAWTHEARTELFVASLRVGVFVAMAGIFWSDDITRGQHAALVSLTGLGLAAIVSLAVAILRYDRWWLPWVFATFDVGLFPHCVLRAALNSELPLDSLLTAPGIWLLAVYLTIAAVRHQPSLIAYYSVLFMTGLVFVYVIAPEAAQSATSVGSEVLCGCSPASS